MRVAVGICGLLLLWVMGLYVGWFWRWRDQMAFYTALDDLLKHRKDVTR